MLVLLATDLPADVWPGRMPKEELAGHLPMALAVPSFADQVATFFEIRSLQWVLERDVAKILGGDLPFAQRPGRARIQMMREVARQVAGWAGRLRP